MTDYFYVLGLPRSRTLWLSYVLSDNQSKCYHEGLTAHGSELLSETGYKYVGSVDTNPLNEFDYNGKLAIIKRNVNDVKKSVINWFKASQFKDNWEDAVDKYIDKYSEALNKKDAYIINYEDLDSIDKLIGLIKYLKPEAEINKAHLMFMQNCIIKTKNRDLTNAVSHTTQFTGSPLIEMGQVSCRRTYDVGFCFDILTNKAIFESISEDGANLSSLNVDVVKDYWLEITVDGLDIGVVQFKPIFNQCWDAHIHILPEHREHSREAGRKIWEWVEENLKSGLVYTNVPVFCPNVRKFLQDNEFEDSGYLKNAWLKKGELNDMWIMTKGIN